MHHFVTEMCTHVHISVTKCCIVGYGTDAFWDLWDGSISWHFIKSHKVSKAWDRRWEFSDSSEIWHASLQTLQQLCMFIKVPLVKVTYTLLLRRCLNGVQLAVFTSLVKQSTENRESSWCPLFQGRLFILTTSGFQRSDIHAEMRVIIGQTERQTDRQTDRQRPST